MPATSTTTSSAAAWTPAVLYEKAVSPNTPISQKGKLRIREGNETGMGPNFPPQTRDTRPHLFPMTWGWGEGGIRGR